MGFPWYAHLLLIRPARAVATVERIRAAGAIEVTPTPWQLCLGALRYAHKLVVHPGWGSQVRRTWRARLLAPRPRRLPFLLWERATSLDLSGLAATPEALIRHLLAAHHDGDEVWYDVELLAHHGRLDELEAAVRAVVEHDTPRSRWLRDLAVFDGYHERILAAITRARAGAGFPGSPDESVTALLRWCARQPATPAATLRAWRAGEFALDS
jgi:hypothetical protein